MYKQLTTGKMENQPKSSHLTAHQDIKRIDIISSPFLGIQQQWKGAQARLHTCFSHFIDAIHQTLQHPGLNRSSIDEIVLRLQFPLFKQGSDAKPGYSRRVEDWPTRLKKTWETVGVHVGQALQAGKDKFAESFRPSANENPVWACSSLSQNAFNSHFEPRHLFDLAMSTEQVAKRLDGIPVYTLSNGSNEFALVSDANNERFVALFCFRPQDAEALLSEVQNREPALVCRAKVVAVSLNKDVVKPHGDNDDYQRRHTLAMMRRLGSENVKIYSEICTSKLQEGAGMDEDVSDSSQVSGTHGKHVRDCKIQIEKQPNIPANRQLCIKAYASISFSDQNLSFNSKFCNRRSVSNFLCQRKI